MSTELQNVTDSLNYIIDNITSVRHKVRQPNGLPMTFLTDRVGQRRCFYAQYMKIDPKKKNCVGRTTHSCHMLFSPVEVENTECFLKETGLSLEQLSLELDLICLQQLN